MDSGELSAEVERFLREHITSHEQLEILLLLRGAAERRWPAEEVASVLAVAVPAASAALEHLLALRLLAAEERAGARAFHFAPTDAELAALVERLAAAYESDRSRIMRTLSRHAIERVRARAARAFLPREPRGGGGGGGG